MVVGVRQFDRGVRLTVTPPTPGSAAAPLAVPIVVNPVPPGSGGVTMPEVKQLRVVFNITKSITPEPQRASITVFNLAATTRAIAAGNAKRAIDIVSPLIAGLPIDRRFAGPGGPIVTSGASGIPYLRLEAGYGPALSTIFEGNNTKVRHRKRGPDWATTFVAGDGELQLNNAIVNKSFEVGTPASVVLAYAVDAMGLVLVPTAGAALLSAYILSGGFLANGLARDAVRDLLSVPEFGLSYFVDAGQLWVLGPAEFVPGPPVIITTERVPSGVQLLEAPEPIDGNGLVVRSLMAPQVRHGAQAQVITPSAAGLYRVEYVAHVGDNRGGQFTTQATLRAITVL